MVWGNQEMCGAPLWELSPGPLGIPVLNLTRSSSEGRGGSWGVEVGLRLRALTPRKDPWPQHPFSDPRRIHNGPSHPISPQLELPSAPDFSARYPSSSSPAWSPATTSPGPYRGWADLANARLLGDGPDFRNVAERVSELCPARLEHRALRRR